MTEYRGFKYWLVETLPSGVKRWRIERPDGSKTATLDRAREADVKAQIDLLIKEGTPK